MKKILILTVGGSCAPIVKSIVENKPGKVHFICSDDDRLSANKGSYHSVIGPGKVCGKDWKNPDQPNIVTQANLEEGQYEIHKIKYFDDHNHCYKFCIDLLRKLKNKNKNAEIIADYTGGTKSMTVGLVMAAADIEDITIAIVKGERTNLIKVDDGTERVNLTRINYAFLEKQKVNIMFLMSEFDYSSARMVLEKMFRTYTDLPKDFEDELHYLFGISKAFESWDKFQHDTALTLLQPFRKKFYPYILFLENIIKSRNCIENGLAYDEKQSGFEVVEDLLLNAQRRAFKNRFDDAVARIYRATELFAQIYLKKQFELHTGDINLEKLPEQIKSYYESKVDDSGKIRLGLMESFKLISKLNDGVIGILFTENEKIILSSLEVRNASILAHGFVPVNKIDFDKVYLNLVQNFLLKGLENVQNKSNLKMQLPQKEF